MVLGDGQVVLWVLNRRRMWGMGDKLGGLVVVTMVENADGNQGLLV